MGIINIIISFTGLPVVISLVVLFIFGLIPLLFPLFFSHKQLKEENLCDGVHIMAIGAEENVPLILDAAGL